MNPDPLWNYIEERERIRLRKEAGEPFPWTADPILRQAPLRECLVRRG